MTASLAIHLRAGAAIIASCVLLAACSPQPVAQRSEQSGGEIGSRAAAEATPAVLTPEQIRLKATVNFLGGRFDGKIGIAVQDLQSGWSTGFNDTEYLPQQSVSKLWVALAALDLADRGQIDLSEEVVVSARDLTVFHQPISSAAKLPGGLLTTLDDLLFRAITQSDNTANDVLMNRIGGPDAIREFLDRKDIDNVRFGPGERLLQSAIAGMDWRPEYSFGKTFFYARQDVPENIRRRAFNAYLDDPVDGASASAIVHALGRLHAGKLLSDQSTPIILAILSQTKSGPKRIKGGIPQGWMVAHKTGTGQVLKEVHSGYNDVGILTAPSGRAYAVAILIGSTAIPVPERMDFMHRVVGAIVEYEQSIAGATE